MRHLHFAVGLMIAFSMPAGVQAGTLENLGFDDYKIVVTSERGKPVYQTVYGQSSLYGICRYGGCRIELLATGQTIDVKKRDDYIVIEDGVMKRKE